MPLILTEDERTVEEDVRPDERFSTLKLIDDYISNMSDAKNTVVGAIRTVRIYLIFSSPNISDYL